MSLSFQEFSKSEASINKMVTILNSKDLSFQRQSFGILNDNEKVEFLKGYLNLHLSSFDKNSDKFRFIDNLINLIDLEYVSKNGKINQIKSDYKAKNLFNKDEYVNIFYKLTNPYSESSTPNMRPPVNKFDCHCGINAVSICNLGSDCNNSVDCERTPSGCYFLFLSPCDGLCWPG